MSKMFPCLPEILEWIRIKLKVKTVILFVLFVISLDTFDSSYSISFSKWPEGTFPDNHQKFRLFFNNISYKREYFDRRWILEIRSCTAQLKKVPSRRIDKLDLGYCCWYCILFSCELIYVSLCYVQSLDTKGFFLRSWIQCVETGFELFTNKSPSTNLK